MSEDDLDMVIALNNLEASKREAMSDESINKFLCEKVERKCWHEFAHTIYKEPLESYKRCVKCGEQWRAGKPGFWPDISTIPPFNPDYLHSGDDYLRLMQAAMKEAW